MATVRERGPRQNQFSVRMNKEAELLLWKPRLNNTDTLTSGLKGGLGPGSEAADSKAHHLLCTDVGVPPGVKPPTEIPSFPFLSGH